MNWDQKTFMEFSVSDILIEFSGYDIEFSVTTKRIKDSRWILIKKVRSSELV